MKMIKELKTMSPRRFIAHCFTATGWNAAAMERTNLCKCRGSGNVRMETVPLYAPKVGETWKKEGSPSLLGSVIIFVTHIAVWRLFSALSAQLSSVDEDSSSAVSSASSFSTAALLLCFPLLLRMPPATRIQFVKRSSVPERNEME